MMRRLHFGIRGGRQETLQGAGIHEKTYPAGHFEGTGPTRKIRTKIVPPMVDGAEW